jgi:hypothetical protein
MTNTISVLDCGRWDCGRGWGVDHDRGLTKNVVKGRSMGEHGPGVDISG